MNKHDDGVISDFGEEWTAYDQLSVSRTEHIRRCHEYLDLLPFDQLPEDAVGFDAGCGTGRWATFAAGKVGTLHCIEPSSAMLVAQRALADKDNCVFHQCTIEDIDLASESMDFGYCLGVLHHMVNTEQGLAVLVDKLKPGAPLLLYLYYAFDNQPLWFRAIWKTTIPLRLLISRLPFLAKKFASSMVATLVYYPAARSALVFEKLGFNVKSFPLSAYRNRSFYTMKTDALDRFGTRLEKRYTKLEVEQLMKRAGLCSIQFKDGRPFYLVLGRKGQ
jgi:SAM-dependent methyltransferase